MQHRPGSVQDFGIAGRSEQIKMDHFGPTPVSYNNCWPANCFHFVDIVLTAIQDDPERGPRPTRVLRASNNGNDIRIKRSGMIEM